MHDHDNHAPFCLPRRFSNSINPLNKVVLNIIIVGGKLGVNLFIMISGYFLIDSRFKPKKLFKLVAEITFYSLLIYAVAIRLKPDSFNDTVFFKNVFAVISATPYWFVPLYLATYILSPYIKKVVENSSQKEMLCLISFLIFMQVVANKFFSYNAFSNTGWFLTLYFIGTYIRLYKNKFFDDNVVMSIFFIISLWLMMYYSMQNIVAYDLRDTACVTATVSLFCWFKNLKIRNSKIINSVSSTTLAIYLIHDNGNIRPYIWKNIFNCVSHEKLSLMQFVVYCLAVVACVFVACMIIDYLRQLLFYLIGKIFKTIRKSISQKSKNASLVGSAVNK